MVMGTPFNRMTFEQQLQFAMKLQEEQRKEKEALVKAMNKGARQPYDIDGTYEILEVREIK